MLNAKAKEHKRKTLEGYTKDRLIDLVMCLEHNNKNLRENFEIQYDNCVKMVSAKDELDKGLKAARKLEVAI